MAPWALDNDPEYHARQMAQAHDCNHDNVTELIECMRGVPVLNITKEASAYVKFQRSKGGMGFGGVTPCIQVCPLTQSYNISLLKKKSWRSAF